MPTAIYQVREVASDDVLRDGDSFPHAVNQSGTSQVIRVSFDIDTYAGPEIVTVPVTVTAGSGTGIITHGTDVDVASLDLHLSAENPVAYLTVTGGSDAGDFLVTLGTSVSDVGSGDFHNAIASVLRFANNSDEAAADNDAPTEVLLTSPAKGASVDASSDLSFKWVHSFDSDQDEIQYSLCFSESASMTNMQCLSVGEEAIVPNSGVAGFDVSAPFASGLIVGSMILVMMWKRFRSPRTRVIKRVMYLGALMLFANLGLAACGSKNLLESLRVPARPTVVAKVPANTLLQAGATHWRVYADDAQGNIVASETRTLDVQ